PRRAEQKAGLGKHPRGLFTKPLELLRQRRSLNSLVPFRPEKLSPEPAGVPAGKIRQGCKLYAKNGLDNRWRFKLGRLDRRTPHTSAPRFAADGPCRVGDAPDAPPVNGRESDSDRHRHYTFCRDRY